MSLCTWRGYDRQPKKTRMQQEKLRATFDEHSVHGLIVFQGNFSVAASCYHNALTPDAALSLSRGTMNHNHDQRR